MAPHFWGARLSSFANTAARISFTHTNQLVRGNHVWPHKGDIVSKSNSSIASGSAILSVLVLIAASCSSPEPAQEDSTPAITYTELATASSAHTPDWSPDGKWIAYRANIDGNSDIWIMPVDGGEARRVTEHAANDNSPRWSPDGDRLLFWSERGGSRNIWTVSPFEGQESLFQVTTDADSVHGNIVNWSPDGSEIVYTSSLGGDWDVRVIPVTGGTSRQVVDTPSNDWDPDWSPDGKWIAYNTATGDSTFNTDLWIVPAAGGTPRRLTSESAPDYNPAWSPDGEWIAFTSGGRESGWRIWLAPAAGGTPTHVSDPELNAIGPRWSPDGQRLVFGVEPRSGDLWTRPVSGGEPVRIAEDVRADFVEHLSCWSPDGSWVAFVRSGPDSEAIWKMPVSGGDPVQVTQGTSSGFATGLSWSPDGKTIAFNSDMSGQTEVWTVPVDGGEPDRITTLGGTGHMEFSPDGQTVAFISRAGGKFNIWTVPSSGGTAEPLVDFAADCWGPSWSPDGTQLAFVSRGHEGGDWYIWILSVESGETTRLAKGVFPAWSRDADDISFVQGTDIWKVAASGGAPALLLTFDGDAPRHAWSPDGSQILYIQRTAGRGLMIADVSGILK